MGLRLVNVKQSLRSPVDGGGGRREGGREGSAGNKCALSFRLDRNPLVQAHTIPPSQNRQSSCNKPSCSSFKKTGGRGQRKERAQQVALKFGWMSELSVTRRVGASQTRSGARRSWNAPSACLGRCYALVMVECLHSAVSGWAWLDRCSDFHAEDRGLG